MGTWTSNSTHHPQSTHIPEQHAQPPALNIRIFSLSPTLPEAIQHSIPKTASHQSAHQAPDIALQNLQNANPSKAALAAQTHTTHPLEATLTAQTHYAEALRQRIAEFLKYPHWLQDQRRTVRIQIQIHANGSLNAVTLLDSSGSTEIDELALSAAEEAAPFPPTPDHQKQTLILPIEFAPPQAVY